MGCLKANDACGRIEKEGERERRRETKEATSDIWKIGVRMIEDSDPTIINGIIIGVVMRTCSNC